MSEACSIFAELESRVLVEEHGLPLKQATAETEGDEESVEIDPAVERTENLEKIKNLIRGGRESLALQLVRSLDDPQIYSELLRDSWVVSDYDEDEGWINLSELFRDHDALFYQILAHAPEEADLPANLRSDSIQDINLSHCSSLNNLDFLNYYPKLESFHIWGWDDSAPGLNDISGLKELSGLKRLTLDGLSPKVDWTALQPLAQLCSLTLSGEKLTLPGSEILSRLTKLKELTIGCNGASEIRGFSGLSQLTSLTLNEAKSLGSLSFAETLPALRYLRINGFGGESIEGIGKCYKITELNISDAGKLEDISELSTLTRLRELTLSGVFQDLDSLMSLTSLETLYVHDAEKLRDIYGLRHCAGLGRVNMHGVSSLGSLRGIGRLSGLQELSITSWENTSGYMDIHEIGGLANLRELTVSCSGRILRGFTALRHLKRLRSLDLSGCNSHRVSDLSPLRKLKMLNSLKMTNCQSIANLDGLSNLHRLEILELANLPRLGSLSGLRESDQLQQLTLTDCNEIESVADLAHLTGLTHLALRYFHKLRDASDIDGMIQLEALDLEGAGRLSDISFLDNLEDLSSLDFSCCNRIHPRDLEHLHEDDFDSLYLPDPDEYEEEDSEEDDASTLPWGERNLDDSSDEAWLRGYDKDNPEKGPGLLQEAVAGRWLDRVPKHILTNENLLAVEAIHIAATSCDFNQLPSSLLTTEHLMKEDVDHFWNVFHFAAAYESLELLPDHLLTEKNLLAPTREDCPLDDNIFAGSNCLHIAAARGVLTLLPRFLLTPQNLLTEDDRKNTVLDQAEIGLQVLRNTIAELKEREADREEIGLNEDWLETVKIQISHLRQQVAEAEIPQEAEAEEAVGKAEFSEGTVIEEEISKEPEVEAEVTESDEKQDELQFDSDGENGPITEPELAAADDNDSTADSEALAEQDESEVESEPAQEDTDNVDSSNHLTEQAEPVEQDRQNGQTVSLFTDVMLDAEEEVAATPKGLNSEPMKEGIDIADESSHPTEQTETFGQKKHNTQSVGIIEVMMSNDEEMGEQVASLQRMSITELSLDDQPVLRGVEPSQRLSVTELSLDDQPTLQKEDPRQRMNVTELSLDGRPSPQKEAVAEEAVAEEAVAEEAVAEEAVAEGAVAEGAVAEGAVAEEAVEEGEISPLVMNTWFHSLDEAIEHPKAVVKLDIIRQESLDRLRVLADFPFLEELHFIKVNIDNFSGLTSAPKLCHIKLESCEVNGWMGLLDLEGLKKLGCSPGFPPEEVKRLLEEEGVEVYLFTPARANETGALGVPASSSEIQTIHEEAFA